MTTLAAVTEDMVALRRQIHAQPELGFEEHRTSELIAQRLQAWGYSVHRGLAGTGVVGTLQRGYSTKKLGLRADMDALPITETAGLPYASRIAGRMHACGHDGHTATPPPCWPRRACWPMRRALRAASTSSSSRPRKAWAAPSA